VGGGGGGGGGGLFGVCVGGVGVVGGVGGGGVWGGGWFVGGWVPRSDGSMRVGGPGWRNEGKGTGRGGERVFEKGGMFGGRRVPGLERGVAAFVVRAQGGNTSMLNGMLGH